MSNLSTCCICLCVYNNEEGLPKVFNNIIKLKEIFKLNVIVFYDISNDKSLDILYYYKNIFTNMDIIINEKEKTTIRTRNIANARNALLQTIRNKYSDFDYFIMMDSNEYSCVGDIKIQSLKDILIRSDEWDGVSFDRISGYYDTWALSFDPHIYSFFHFKDWRKTVAQMRKDSSILLKNHKETGKELIPIYSAFNGFAIYKTEKFINCSYSDNIDLNLFPHNSIQNQENIVRSNIIDKVTEDCEHRHFHLEAIAKNKAKIRICTNYIFDKVPNPRPGLRGPC